MCFNPVTALTEGISSMLSQYMQIQAHNKQAAANYNFQARQAEQTNRAAIAQQVETDSRNRIASLRGAETAADRARATILQNRQAQGTARASAGASGLMGLPFNMIDQTYQSMIGGVGTNLSSQYQQMDENYFFNSMNTMLQAKNITNQAKPQKPQLQSFGWANYFQSVLAAVSGGFGGSGQKNAMNLPSQGTTQPTNSLTGTMGDFGSDDGGNSMSMAFA